MQTPVSLSNMHLLLLNSMHAVRSLTTLFCMAPIRRLVLVQRHREPIGDIKGFELTLSSNGPLTATLQEGVAINVKNKQTSTNIKDDMVCNNKQQQKQKVNP